MTDDLNDTGPEDALRVNVHEEWEVRYWCKALDCTSDELCAAVDAVGVMADDVREFLRCRH